MPPPRGADMCSKSRSNETGLGLEPRTFGSKYAFDLFRDPDKIFTGKKAAGPHKDS